LRLLALLAALLAAGCGARSAEARSTVVEDGTRFTCTTIAVWDGDGPVWCAEGPKLRLSGIAAREHDETCRDGQPCPAASGRAARDALVLLLGGPKGLRPEGHVKVAGVTLACTSEGSARGDRTAAWCTLPDGRELSCAMIATGTALRWARYDLGDRCHSAR